MNPFLNDPRRTIHVIVYVVLAILACFYITSCSAIKYRAGVTYHGATLSYDGKAIVLGVDGDRLENDIRGYAK
jgi:hypothetical protein